MIISVNGREKKIAILDDGKVSEFYIERGEDNSGVVGNIYKGRVQRVLPGMQSAFVEIGLERDAFLYVSDFFDEEEEIERIVVFNASFGADIMSAGQPVRKISLEERTFDDTSPLAGMACDRLPQNASEARRRQQRAAATVRRTG